MLWYIEEYKYAVLVYWDHPTICVQSQMQIDYNFMKQSLEEERYRSDRLEEQINDLTELHQHEVTNLKQVCHWYQPICLV